MLSLKKRIANFIRGFGYELKPYNIRSSEDALMRKMLADYHIDLVIDVGGSSGQYAENVWGTGYKGKLISFEPVKAVYKVISHKAQQNPLWETYQYALGDANGEASINVAANLQSSSLLNMDENHLKAGADSAYQYEEKITVKRFDTLWKELGLAKYQNILFKMDVQGYEHKVLDGMGETLKQMKFIEAELSFVPLYQGGLLYQELIAKLDTLGFQLYSMAPDYRDMQTGMLLQANGIFINKKLSAFVNT